MLSALTIGTNYTLADIRKRPRNCVVGLISIFLVVFFVGIIIMGVSKTDVVMLRFAEIQVGEMDLLLLAQGGVPFVNYTYVSERSKASSLTTGVVPRWILRGTMRSEDDLNGSFVTANVAFLDTELEEAVGIGRDWKPRIIGRGEAHAWHSLLRLIGVRPNRGRRAQLSVDIGGILNQQNISADLFDIEIPNLVNGTVDPNATVVNISDIFVTDPTLPPLNLSALATAFNTTTNVSATSSLFTDALEPSLSLSMADAVENSAGKYPGILGNIVIMDAQQLLKFYLEQTCYETLRTPLQPVLGIDTLTTPILPTTEVLEETFRLYDYALLIVGMYRDRFTAYYKGRRGRHRDFIRFSNDFFLSVGLDFAAEVEFPISLALDGFYFLSLFITQLFNSMTAVIIALGTLLVFNLLITNAEERTYELALLRSQGMDKFRLVVLMFCQSLVFIVPGVAIAISVVLAVNAILEVVLAEFTHAPVRTNNIPPAAIIVPVLLGILMPVVANYKPMKDALQQSLRDALDVYRQRVSETSVKMRRLSEYGLEPWQTMLGWFLVISGFVVYYMIPYSFIFDELWLFFLILNIILLCMLFGLCMISLSLQGPLETATLWLLLWGKEKRLWRLITRNLQSHRSRSSKSFIMFTITAACIIFGFSFNSLLTNSIRSNVQVLLGADVVVQSLDFDNPLDRGALEQFLVQKQSEGRVASYSFVTFDLDDYEHLDSTKIASIVGFPSSRILVTAVDKNYMDTVYTEFFLPTDYDNTVAYESSSNGVAEDPVRSLYTDKLTGAYTPVTEKLFTGFPIGSNISEPEVEIKSQMGFPVLLSAAAEPVMGMSAQSVGTLEFEVAVGSVAQKETYTSLYLFKPRAMVKKLPGFITISSLRFTLGASPIIVAVDDFESLLNTNDVDRKSDPNRKLPLGNVTTPRFAKLMVRLPDGTSDEEREDFVNLLQTNVNPYYHITTDTVEVVESVRIVGQLIEFFFFFVASVGMLLDACMLWLTFVMNVQQNAWSFAVLRATGFNYAQLIRAFTYEALSVVLSSFAVGTAIGIVVAFTLMLQLNLFLELPLQLDFPFLLFFILFGFAILSAAAGSYFPAKALSRRPISSLLKSG